MKINIIVLIAFLVFHNDTYSQSIFETFDDYNVGDKVSEVSPNFYAWSFNPDAGRLIAEFNNETIDLSLLNSGFYIIEFLELNMREVKRQKFLKL